MAKHKPSKVGDSPPSKMASHSAKKAIKAPLGVQAKGRPSSYSPSVGDTICTRISEGESLRRICMDDGMPDKTTVLRWLSTQPEFRTQYAHARELQADALAEECLDIADDGSNDWMEQHDAEGNSLGWKLNGEAVQRSRLRLEQRRWYASKLAPKKYGEKLDLTSGGNALQPPRVIIKPPLEQRGG